MRFTPAARRRGEVARRLQVEPAEVAAGGPSSEPGSSDVDAGQRPGQRARLQGIAASGRPSATSDRRNAPADFGLRAPRVPAQPSRTSRGTGWCRCSRWRRRRAPAGVAGRQAESAFRFWLGIVSGRIATQCPGLMLQRERSACRGRTVRAVFRRWPAYGRSSTRSKAAATATRRQPISFPLLVLGAIGVGSVTSAPARSMR